MLRVRTCVCLLALASGLASAGAPPLPGQDDPILGTLDEGKTYRLVDGVPISGRAVADLLIEPLWKSSLEAFAENVLVKEEMERKGIVVTDEEVDAELRARAVAFVRSQGRGMDPRLLGPDEMAKRLRYSLKFMGEQTRVTLGLKKMLVQGGLLKAQDVLDDPLVAEVLKGRLEKLGKERGVESDSKKLSEGEVLRVGGRGFGRAEVRTFALEQLGPLTRSQLVDALNTLTLEWLVERALKEKGRSGVTRDDRTFHFSLRARQIEAENGAPNGRDALLFQIGQMGWTPEQFMNDHAFTIDAGITALVRDAIHEPELQAEYQARKGEYQRAEKLIAHIFVRVTDPQGRPYGPQWRAPGHEKLNKFVDQQREERFATEKPRIERLAGLARGDFAAAAEKGSDCELTRKLGGVIGRIGPKTVLPELPVDEALSAEALKLKPGELSAPVRSSFGWHLLKCLENQETTYDEARERVYLALLKRQRKELAEALQKKADIKDKF